MPVAWMKHAVVLSAMCATIACGPAVVATQRAPSAREEPAVTLAQSTPSASPPRRAAPELHEIPLPGDGRTFVHALAEVVGGVALLASTPEGLVRATVDLDARAATPGAPLAVDRFPERATYDAARDGFWWVTAGEQEQLPPQGREMAPRTLTRSILIADLAGLRAEIDRCPEPAPPPVVGPRSRRRGASVLGSIGAGLVTGGTCDHQVTTLLPVSSGLLVGGSLSSGTPSAPRPWLGLVSAEGTLVAEATLGDPSTDGRVVALAATDAGVFVLVASGFGSITHATIVLLREGTLERVATATLATPSHAPRPRFAMSPAPGGGVFVLVPRVTDLLVLAEVARDGSVVREQPIAGVPLTVLGTTELSTRAGAPWLSIVDSRGGRETHLVLARIDPLTGAPIESHELTLPDRFVPERTLATDEGYVLAGRVDLARPIVAWIPLPSEP